MKISSYMSRSKWGKPHYDSATTTLQLPFRDKVYMRKFIITNSFNLQPMRHMLNKFFLKNKSLSLKLRFSFLINKIIAHIPYDIGKPGGRARVSLESWNPGTGWRCWARTWLCLTICSCHSVTVRWRVWSNHLIKSIRYTICYDIFS